MTTQDVLAKVAMAMVPGPQTLKNQQHTLALWHQLQNEPRVVVYVRMHWTLKKRVKAAAAAAGLTMNDWVLLAIARELRSESAWTRKT